LPESKYPELQEVLQTPFYYLLGEGQVKHSLFADPEQVRQELSQACNKQRKLYT